LAVVGFAAPPLSRIGLGRGCERDSGKKMAAPPLGRPAVRGAQTLRQAHPVQLEPAGHTALSLCKLVPRKLTPTAVGRWVVGQQGAACACAGGPNADWTAGSQLKARGMHFPARFSLSLRRTPSTSAATRPSCQLIKLVVYFIDFNDAKHIPRSDIADPHLHFHFHLFGLRNEDVRAIISSERSVFHSLIYGIFNKQLSKQYIISYHST